MRFDIMTLFPELVQTVLSASVIGRAQEAGYLTVNAVNIRDYSEDRRHRVDDTPFGGGKGMLIAAPPVYACYKAIESSSPAGFRRRVIFMSPQGKVLTQKKAKELAGYDQLVILCGHYEGIDERVLEEIVDEEISVGDYILTGGEIPACILCDCVGRLIDGVLADTVCYEDESIASGLLEYPQYTRPVEFLGKEVPAVLRSGNHHDIDLWRRKMALERTKRKRPDLL